MLSSKFWYAFEIFFLFSLPSLLQITMRIKERERERDEKDLEGAPKHQWWHHQYCRKDLKDMNPKTLKNIINDNWGGPHEPPKGKWVTCHIGWLVWPILVTIGNRTWWRWIRLIEIFLTVSMVSSLEFWCDFRVSLFFISIFSLSCLYCNLLRAILQFESR